MADKLSSGPSYSECLARAQHILDVRGRPPYLETSFGPNAHSITADELSLISEFVQYWRPKLTEKEKKNV